MSDPHTFPCERILFLSRFLLWAQYSRCLFGTKTQVATRNLNYFPLNNPRFVFFSSLHFLFLRSLLFTRCGSVVASGPSVGAVILFLCRNGIILTSFIVVLRLPCSPFAESLSAALIAFEKAREWADLIKCLQVSAIV